MKIEELHLEQYTYKELDQLYKHIGKLKNKIYRANFLKKYTKSKEFKEKRKKWDKKYREKKKLERLSNDKKKV